MLITLYRIYRMAFLPRKNNNDFAVKYTEKTIQYKEINDRLVADVLSEPFEDVWTTAEDGLKLHGYGYFTDPSAPVSICFHGYNGTARRDFAGGFKILKSLGHNIILVDQRSQGKSEGRCITYGIKERFDCLAWTKYAKKRFGGSVRVYLMGISLGGATVLMASNLDYSGSVRGIIADCPFSSGYDIIKRVAVKSKGIPAWICPLVKKAAKIYGRFNLTEITAAEAVSKSIIPMMIIHGEADNFVPSSMSEEIAEANPQLIERHTFPSADHGISYVVDPLRYEMLVKAFLEKNS